MFAVIRTGGKQYRVHPGDKIVVEKLEGNAGDTVKLGDVLLAGEGSDFRNTQGLIVDAEIVAQAKADKVTVFKKRRRHNYRRKKGHRQQHTILKIVSIGGEKAQKKSAAPKAEAAPAAPAKAVKEKPAAKPSSAEPATVEATPTENPAPTNEAQANPPAQSVDAPPKAAKNKPADKPTAKTQSTKNAAPAKGGAKKAPKGK
jgi:large subunit ribosomal protein L21